MNLIEGAQRMQRAGRWIVYIAVGLCVLLLGMSAVSTLIPNPMHGLGLMDLTFVLIFLAAPGGVLWLGGWILEGFAKKTP
jgi:hypothetical protein